MNRDYNASQIIRSEFPALAYRHENEGIRGVLNLVQSLSNYTMEQLLAGNEVEIEHCLKVAQQILISGSNITKLATRQLFVHNVGALLELTFTVSQNIRNLFAKIFGRNYQTELFD